MERRWMMLSKGWCLDGGLARGTGTRGVRGS